MVKKLDAIKIYEIAESDNTADHTFTCSGAKDGVLFEMSQSECAYFLVVTALNQASSGLL